MPELLRRVRPKEPAAAEPSRTAENLAAPDTASRLAALREEIGRLEALSAANEHKRAEAESSLAAFVARRDDALAGGDEAAVDAIEREQRQARRQHDAAQILRDRARARLAEVYREADELAQAERLAQRRTQAEALLAEGLAGVDEQYEAQARGAELILRRERIFELLDELAEVGGPALAQQLLYGRERVQEARRRAFARIGDRFDLHRLVF